LPTTIKTRHLDTYKEKRSSALDIIVKKTNIQ